MLDRQQIDQAKKIAIFSHINPDWDAVWSSLGLKRILTNMGKDAKIFLSKKPESFNFLPWFEDIQTEFDNKNYDLIFVLDCWDIYRVEPFNNENPDFFKKNKIIVIDHHIPSKNWFWVETLSFFEKPLYSSTCEYVFDLFSKDYNKYFDADVATNLFFGIYTDTGGFIHEEDTIRVFDTCSKLFKLGANKALIIDKFVKWKSFQEIKFLWEIINRTKYEWDIIYTYYDMDEFKSHWISESPKIWYDILSKINWPKALVIGKKDWDKIRFWMRSKWKYNVQKIASQFWWGWHKYASGFSISITNDHDYIQEIKNTVKKINNLI